MKKMTYFHNDFKGSSGPMSRFRVSLNAIVITLEKIIDEEEPLVNSRLWAERIRALEKLRNLDPNDEGYDLGSTLEKLNDAKGELLPSSISDDEYLLMIKNIFKKSTRGLIWSKYNAFVDDLRELIINSDNLLQPHTFPNRTYVPVREMNEEYNELKKKIAWTDQDNHRLQKEITDLETKNSSLTSELAYAKARLSSYKNGGKTSEQTRQIKEEAKNQLNTRKEEINQEYRDELNKLIKENDYLEEKLLVKRMHLNDTLRKLYEHQRNSPNVPLNEETSSRNTHFSS